MMKLYLAIIFYFVLGCSKFCHAQQPLMKNEIYDSWIKSHPIPVNCDTLIDQLSYDSKIDDQIQKTIQSLRSKGVDTLLVLVNSHPGTLIADTCRVSNYPAEVYIFWRVGGKELLKRNHNKCGLDNTETICSPVLDFFSKHQRQLEREYIMPVILSAKRQANKIVYNRIISSDIDEYVLYYFIHGHCKRFDFSKADITNKNNLFYSNNIKSRVYQGFVALKKECMKLEESN